MSRDLQIVMSHHFCLRKAMFHDVVDLPSPRYQMVFERPVRMQKLNDIACSHGSLDYVLESASAFG